MKINRIAPDEHKYLQIISGIALMPKQLHYIGNLPETRLPTVAIVGTRRPTTYGREVTQSLAYDLAKRGIVIISGLALGVDSIAHRAALDAGGTTLAVLACGLPRIYPAAHRGLANEIVSKGGVVMSEYEPETEPRTWQFLERNRIVSGLSDAIIITEAAARSGTLSTAAHALQQGKEVFVVPGNITSPLSAGCNNLIKQGATPVTSVDDILAVVAPSSLTKQTQLALGDTADETAILQQLGQGVRDGDELQRITAVKPGDFATALTMLELNGAIRALGGNQWTLK